MIIESQKDGVKVFLTVSQEKIDIIFNEYIKEITNAKNAVMETFIEIKKGNKPTSTPRLQLFEGKNEMRHITKELLLYKNINAKSYWPIKLMLEVLGEDFFKEFNKDRIKRGIQIEAIWPESQVIDMHKYPFMGSGGDFLRETRVAPKEIDFRMGYWIYENKVSFISSSKDNFGFIIESQEFADMLTSQFDVMWNLSKKINVTDEESKEWFEKMYKK